MCSANDHPPYHPLTESPRVLPRKPAPPTIDSVAALAVAMSGEIVPNVYIIEQAEMALLRLAIRGWVLVNLDEDGS